MTVFGRMLFCAVLWEALVQAAHAGPNPKADSRTCSNASGEVAIAACNRAIQSRTFRGRGLAVLYQNRGVEWDAKRDYDRAIADYTEAIKLNPK